MTNKTKFHIADVLSVITGVLLPVPNCPSIAPDGTRGPTRVDDIDGLVELVEYVTGEKIATRRDPITGNKGFDSLKLLHLAKPTRDTLLMQFPDLARVQEPDLEEFIDDNTALANAIKQYLRPYEEKYGAYLEVDPPMQQHRKQINRQGGNSDPFPPFSLN